MATWGSDQFEHRYIVLDTHNSKQALNRIANIVLGEDCDFSFQERMDRVFTGCEFVGCDEADARIINTVHFC